MAHIVTTALVIAHTPAGDRYVYQGGALPHDIDPDQLEQLLNEKQVAVGDPTSDGTAEDASNDGKPSGNASLEEWQAYALGHGLSDDDIEGLSRNELRDRFA